MNRDLNAFFAVAGILAGGFAFGAMQRSPLVLGATLIAGGLVAVLVAPSLANAQRQLAELRWMPSAWSAAQPFKVRLWGFGLIVVGALMSARWLV